MCKLGILITTTADHSTLLLLKKNVEDLFAIGDIVYAHSPNKPWENAERSTNFPSSNNVLLIVILVKKQFAGFLQMYTSESRAMLWLHLFYLILLSNVVSCCVHVQLWVTNTVVCVRLAKLPTLSTRIGSHICLVTSKITPIW